MLCRGMREIAYIKIKKRQCVHVTILPGSLISQNLVKVGIRVAVANIITCAAFLVNYSRVME